jgi:hypothetical protein
VPVPIAVALTRVTVGNTAWLAVKLTPSWRSRHRFGVSSGVMASGRRPSSTSTMLSVARPAAAEGGTAATESRIARADRWNALTMVVQRMAKLPDTDVSSCPRLSRASTPCSLRFDKKDVDGRDKPGHDGE